MKNLLYILLFLPLAVFGQDNYSLSFDGDTDRVEIPSDLLTGLNSFSVSAMFRAGSIQSGNSNIFQYDPLQSDYPSLYIRYPDGGQSLNYTCGDSNITPQIQPSFNVWNFTTISYDGDSVRAFLNGVNIGTYYSNGDIFPSEPSDPIYIGNWKMSEGFNGNIDNFQFWNSSLSQEEIQYYMYCPPTGNEDELVGYWNFNEGSGDTVYDISGNGNDGIIYGATFSEDVPENNCFGCTDNLAINYDDLAGENDSSCTYNTYPIEDENFKDYLQSNYPQTIVNDSLNLNATLGIEDLNVDSLEISSLDGLQHFHDLINLNCVANNLSTLPELPSQIEYINCQWNQIDTLPNFPESLKNFDGRHNLITVVPELPNTMEVLRVCFNEVTTIPELPDSLKILFCAYNYEQLTYLPDFPDHLEEVLCFDNEIEQISDIPETMYKFMMQNNSITQIPNIPEGVNILNLTNNPIECVNDYPEQFEEQLGIYPPCSFLDEYIALMDSLDQLSNSNDQLQEDLSVFETVEDEQDYSMRFDGVDDYVLIENDNYYLDNYLSVFINCKINNFNSEYSLITKMNNAAFNEQFYCGVKVGGYLHFGVKKNSNCIPGYGWQTYTTSDVLVPNIWTKIGFVYDNISLRIFVNHELFEEFNVIDNSLIDNCIGGTLKFGKNWNGDPEYLDGQIDNASVWSNELSHEEIQSYLSCPPTGEEEGLVGYWNFNEGSGDTVYDISGNGNHGVINGAEFSEDIPETNSGCTDEDALNYAETANCDNGSCVYGDEIVSNLEENLSSVIDSLGITLSNLDDCNTEAINALSSLQLALYNWNTIIDLQEGWNMFGYGCPSSIDVAEGLSNHTESITIVKDNNGSVYMPEFGFNGIGNFTPGFGYQIKLSEAIEGFSLCDWYVNDIPVDNIVTLNDINVQLQGQVDFMSPSFGCVDETACNHDDGAIIDNNSCLYPADGFDCDGNVLPQYQVGDSVEGGIVFYIDETGYHGLISSTDDLYGYIMWGCYGGGYINGSGAGLEFIGSGLQNSLDIVSECYTSGPTAASLALEYENYGFTDWYLPSINELLEMYNTIGPGGLDGNLGGFMLSETYWSSTVSQVNSPNSARCVQFSYGLSSMLDTYNIGKVRPIRSF